MDIKSHLITLDIIFLEFLCFSDDVEIIFCFVFYVVRRVWWKFWGFPLWVDEFWPPIIWSTAHVKYID